MARDPGDQYSDDETKRRFETALRGSLKVGHKPQSEMKLGKPRGKQKKNPAEGQKPKS